MSNAPTPAPANPARTWEMLCHLSALAGFIIPFGNFLGPFVIWQIKKNEFPSVEAHGKEALNFQITVTIAVLVCLALSCVVIGLPLLFAVAIANIVFIIIASIKVNNGQPYKYPATLRLIK
jgi:uncharacterized Tic20 family protein